MRRAAKRTSSCSALIRTIFKNPVAVMENIRARDDAFAVRGSEV